MTDEQPDLEKLLLFDRAVEFDVWLDPLSPATSLLLPYLDLDGHTNGGRPWRFRGSQDVGLRLLPDPDDALSCVAARCILAVRAWAVRRAAGDNLIPMDYDLPWAYLGAMLRDIRSVRTVGLPHLVSLAGREGEWLGDWVAEYRDSDAVRSALAAEIEEATALGVTDAPTIIVRNLLYDFTNMPDDIAEQITIHLAQTG